MTHSKYGLKWDTYIQKSIKLAYSKMWILNRLAEVGVSIDDLRIAYLRRVRVHLELNVPLFHFSISKALSQKIERVQKACLYIILGRHATSDYFCNLAMLNLEPLANRREVLSNKFARKTVKHPAHSQMFTFANRHNARSGRKVIEPTAKTARYRKSSIPSLAKLINAM